MSTCNIILLLYMRLINVDKSIWSAEERDFLTWILMGFRTFIQKIDYTQATAFKLECMNVWYPTYTEMSGFQGNSVHEYDQTNLWKVY